ncbi:gamma carbonic anhydrase family protein [Pseudomonadales bacterium]|nr:gamma carbonic anhydrase family protein [Pseudomonadales bacterium]
MMYSLGEYSPLQHQPINFVAPNAQVIGRVEIKANASIWFAVVIRADVESITIGEGANIQDAAVLHADPGYPLIIGRHVTVGHKAMLHGCSIGDNSLVGINAVILNGAKIGNYCLIGANALVTENTVIPDGVMFLGSPGKVVRKLSEDECAALSQAAHQYITNGQAFMRDLKLVDPLV